MGNISNSKLRNFSYIVGIGIPLVIGWLIPKFTGHEFRLWTLFIGLPILIIGLFAPKNLLYIYKIWMQIGHILGYINSRIILGLVFLFVLQPIALIMKFTGYDPLRLKIKGTKTYKEFKHDSEIDLSRIF